jgi:hypothetical protein
VAGLVLELTQNGRSLGRWTLGESPIEMFLTDAETGKVVGVFSAASPFNDASEKLFSADDVAVRVPGDDLTMPLPEPTGEISATIDVEAELWVRSGAQWQRRGVLKPGQKASFHGAKIRLKKNGVLVVNPGPSLSGGAELPGGREQQIKECSEPFRFPPGTSVILTSSLGLGFYIKNRLGENGFRPIVEHNNDWVSPSKTYIPPSSDLG